MEQWYGSCRLPIHFAQWWDARKFLHSHSGEEPTARYFTGRRQIGEQFTVDISSHKKLLCKIFMFWEDRPGYKCACAQKKKITAEKSSRGDYLRKSQK